jgi:hypothetical protein
MNSDVLHYGAMLKDPDRPSFEVDMQREVSDLLRTGTVEITPRSLVPFGLKNSSIYLEFSSQAGA